MIFAHQNSALVLVVTVESIKPIKNRVIYYTLSRYLSSRYALGNDQFSNILFFLESLGKKLSNAGSHVSTR